MVIHVSSHKIIAASAFQFAKNNFDSIQFNSCQNRFIQFGATPSPTLSLN